MFDQNPNGRFLPLLRELQAKGATAELLALIKHLKKAGYPKSILRAFELGCSCESPVHPYRYDCEDAVRHLGQIVPSPRVSVIVVVYDSADHLEHLLQTLQCQSYTNYELIIVNNGEEDLSGLLSSWPGSIQLIEAANPGFAEANNIGLEKVTGDVLLLLNPDTELQTETIKELVHALEIDSTAAAAIPLIYFSRPFYKLSVTNIGTGYFALNSDSMLAELQYKKLFVRDGERRDDGLIYCNASQHISLDIALNAESECFVFEVLLFGSPGQQPCLQIAFEGSGERACLISIDQPKTIVRLSLTKRVHSKFPLFD